VDVIALLAAAALAPWTHPLVFGPLSGWARGASGTVPSLYGPAPVRAPKESSAWIARNVRYRDPATADPPNRTLAHLPARGIVVWAVIFQGVQHERHAIKLNLRSAKYFPCCEGERVRGGSYELHGWYGPRRAYTVYVRVYFGSRADLAACAQAQHALDRLTLPTIRQA
jgi:hypothetical protein